MNQAKPCPDFTISPPLDLGADTTIYTLSSEENACHAIVRWEKTLLINCPPGISPELLASSGLPEVVEIWLTETDPFLMDGSAQFEVPVRVPTRLLAIVQKSSEVQDAKGTKWVDPGKWPETFGREQFGIAGSPIFTSPATSPKSLASFDPGDVLRFQDLDFEVIDLGLRNFYSVGFRFRINGEKSGVFTGALIDGCGNLCDAHGFEANYAGIPWAVLSRKLSDIAGWEEPWLFPSRGNPLEKPATILDQLASRIDRFVDLGSKPTSLAPRPYSTAKEGRYHNHGDGIYQIDNAGNVILFIDQDGCGMMIDPGPCDYDNPNREEDFKNDLAFFEKQAGLRAIQQVLVTHFHGDHYDLWPIVKERYPSCRLGAWEVVAAVMEAPQDFPFACRLPWYGAGWDSCSVNDHLSRMEPFQWNKIEIHTVHLPGHCNAHAGYWFDWNGRRILISGDSVQTCGAPDNLSFIQCNHSIPNTPEGHSQAYQNIVDLNIDLNLGGHGSHFINCRETYIESLHRIQTQTDALLALFTNRPPEELFLRPSIKEAAEKTRALMIRS